MAVLGVHGFVRFRREAPSPIVVTAASLRADIDTFQVESTEFWNGDEVYLLAPNGLPFSADTLPEGVGCYFGSYWELGSIASTSPRKTTSITSAVMTAYISTIEAHLFSLATTLSTEISLVVSVCIQHEPLR